jgi:hypothetical protein
MHMYLYCRHAHTHCIYAHRNIYIRSKYTSRHITYMNTHTPQVHQAEAGNDELLSIDGKMLNILMKNDRIVRLQQTSPALPAEWEQAIAQCFESRAGALIDAGALLAGNGNRQAAKHILLHMPEAYPYRGVIFFDVEEDDWRIRARDGQEWSKRASPIPERACFALFDERQCRGADLKLAHDTLAMVSVGSKMCKDTLMQAAGRMRRLSEGQKLMFAVSSDVAIQIVDMMRDCMSASAEVKDTNINMTMLLQWVMRNTVCATMDGMITYVQQGIVYAAARVDRENAKLEEVLQLVESYAHATEAKPVDIIIKNFLAARKSKSAKLGNAFIDEEMTQQLLRISEEFGGDFCRKTNKFDEACERELEQQQEQEEEQEKQIPKLLPHEHREWFYEALFTAQDTTELKKHINVEGIATLLTRKAHTGSSDTSQNRLAHIVWPAQVSCTENFKQTVIWKHDAEIKDEPGSGFRTHMRWAEVRHEM